MFEYICWFIKANDDSYLYKSIFHSFLAKIISVLFYLNRPKHTTLLSCELFIAGNELPAEGPVSFLSAIKTVVLHFCGKHFFLFWIQLIGEGYNTSRATLGLYVLQSQPPCWNYKQQWCYRGFIDQIVIFAHFSIYGFRTLWEAILCTYKYHWSQKDIKLGSSCWKILICSFSS